MRYTCNIRRSLSHKAKQAPYNEIYVGHAFRSDFNLTYRSNITDAGFPGLGQRYVTRIQYEQFISSRGFMKGDIQHTDLLCSHVVQYFLKQLLTNKLMFIRFSDERKGKQKFLSDKIQQIA